MATTTIARPPRMTDFAHWVVAGEAALGIKAGEFLRVYRANRAAATEIVLGTSPIPMAIRTLLEKQTGETFTGTATELLEALNGVVDEGVSRRREWPKGANVVSGQLKRLAPALRMNGIAIDEEQSKGGNSRKTWTLHLRPAPQETEVAKSPSDASPPRRQIA